MKKPRDDLTQKTLYGFFKIPSDRLKKLMPGVSKYNPRKHRKEAIANSKSIRSDHNYIHTRAHKGVLYVALNEFSEFIAINLFDRLDPVLDLIIPSGEKIAEASVDSDAALTFIGVDKRFRRQKIGSELIRFMKQRCEKFHVYDGQDYNSCYRLTKEGKDLMQYCLNQNILKHEDFISSEVPVPASPSKKRF